MFKKIISLMLIIMLTFTLTSISVFATEDEVDDYEDLITDYSLTPDGNLTLVDDYTVTTDAGEKEFIVLQTRNGSYFYLVIDRTGTTENVYFLNLVDETDLASIISEIDPDYVISTDTTQDSQTEETETTDSSSSETTITTDSSSSNTSTILLSLLVLVCLGGGFLYFKQNENKQKSNNNNLINEEAQDDDFINGFEQKTPIKKAVKTNKKQPSNSTKNTQHHKPVIQPKVETKETEKIEEIEEIDLESYGFDEYSNIDDDYAGYENEKF